MHQEQPVGSPTLRREVMALAAGCDGDAAPAVGRRPRRTAPRPAMRLHGCRVGVVVAGATAGAELAATIAALTASGATVRSASRGGDPAACDALLLAAGGAALSDRAAVLLRQMLADGKPVAALGAGGALALAGGDGVRGLRIAVPHAVADTLRAAGAQCVPDVAAIADRGVVTGSGAAFVAAVLAEFAAEFPRARPARSPTRARPPVVVAVLDPGAPIAT